MRALAIMPVPMKPMLFDIVVVGLERTREGEVMDRRGCCCER